MSQIFYVIHRKNMDEFLSVWEDGEGNVYYYIVAHDEINRGAIFQTEKDAKFCLKEFANMSEFAKFLPENHTEFCNDAIVEKIIVTFEEN